MSCVIHINQFVKTTKKRKKEYVLLVKVIILVECDISVVVLTCFFYEYFDKFFDKFLSGRLNRI